LAAAIAATSCSGDSRLHEIAVRACGELEGAIVLQVGSILDGAIAEAEDAGHTAPELGDEMREECPDMMAAVESIDEDEARARHSLINEVDLQLGGCISDWAEGTVTNNAPVAVDVFIDVQFLADDGTLIDTTRTVTSLRPGQTGEWDAFFFGADYARCRADLSSVNES
jgi:hypothetical protein